MSFSESVIPWRRYLCLFYSGLWMDSSEEFEDELRKVLPHGCRWYGVRCRKVLRNGEKELYRQKAEWNDVEGCYEDRWVEVSVDFAGVEETMHIEVDKPFFRVSGVQPELCFYVGDDCAEEGTEDDDGSYCTNESCIWDRCIKGVCADQVSMQRNENSVGVFGERLVEECEEYEGCKDCDNYVYVRNTEVVECVEGCFDLLMELEKLFLY